LQAIRELVVRNEGLTSLIRMDFNVLLNYGSEEEPSPSSTAVTPSGHLRGGVKAYTHYAGTWAHDEAKQHASTDYFYAPDKIAKSYVSIIDGEVMKWGVKPDLMQGAIHEIGAFDWQAAGPTKLGLRVFEGQNLLSEILVPACASLQNDTQTVDGRKAYVVDAKGPVANPSYFARIWIDAEGGVPLRIEYYDRHPESSQSKLLSRVESIELHELPNGGLIPVDGIRSVHFYKPNTRVKYERIAVDVNTVTIKPEDVPESMFTLEFAEGARVYNSIVGVTTGTGGDSDRLVEDAIAALENPAAANAKPPSSQQHVTQEPPTDLTSSPPPNSVALLDTYEPTTQSFTLAWVFLSALLAGFATTIIVWIVRCRRKTTIAGDGK